MSRAIPRIPAGSRAPVPARWRRDVERILIAEEDIELRLKVMAREIQRDFIHHELVVVSLLNGTVMFLADLIRHLSLPLRLDFIGVSSYRAGTKSGHLVFTKELRLDIRHPACFRDGFCNSGDAVRNLWCPLVGEGKK